MPSNRREYMREYMANRRRLEKERGLVKGPKGKVDTGVDTSTRAGNVVRGTRPTFLAAPDDDCASCGHDRQSWHLEGVCRAAVGYRRSCGCPAFVDAAEPF